MVHLLTPQSILHHFSPCNTSNYASRVRKKHVTATHQQFAALLCSFPPSHCGPPKRRRLCSQLLQSQGCNAVKWIGWLHQDNQWICLREKKSGNPHIFHGKNHGFLQIFHPMTGSTWRNHHWIQWPLRVLLAPTKEMMVSTSDVIPVAESFNLKFTI